MLCLLRLQSELTENIFIASIQSAYIKNERAWFSTQISSGDLFPTRQISMEYSHRKKSFQMKSV